MCFSFVVSVYIYIFVCLPVLMPELAILYNSGNSAIDISKIVYFGWLL